MILNSDQMDLIRRRNEYTLELAGREFLFSVAEEGFPERPYVGRFTADETIFIRRALEDTPTLFMALEEAIEAREYAERKLYIEKQGWIQERAGYETRIAAEKRIASTKRKEIKGATHICDTLNKLIDWFCKESGVKRLDLEKAYLVTLRGKNMKIDGNCQQYSRCGPPEPGATQTPTNSKNLNSGVSSRVRSSSKTPGDAQNRPEACPVP